jgi:hypothetical protein
MAKKVGLQHKVAAAVLLSERTYGCTGTVVVIDRDADESRRVALVDACERVICAHPLVSGVAVESIEAWTLGAPEAIAAVLGGDEEGVRKQVPSGGGVEALYQNSGKLEHRPKELLDRIAATEHRVADITLRREVAERTDGPRSRGRVPMVWRTALSPQSR